MAVHAAVGGRRLGSLGGVRGTRLPAGGGGGGHVRGRAGRGVWGRDPRARGLLPPALGPREFFVPCGPAPALGPRAGLWFVPRTWDAPFPEALEESRPSSRLGGLAPRQPLSLARILSPSLAFGDPPLPPFKSSVRLSGVLPCPLLRLLPPASHALTSFNVTYGPLGLSPARNFDAKEKPGLVSQAF